MTAIDTMRRAVLSLAATLAASGLAATAVHADPAVLRELAPNGVLRVAIGISSVPSVFSAVRDAASNEPRGVTVELGTELAKKLGVRAEFVTYPTSGALIQAAASGAWSVAFVPVDEERKKAVDFGPAYVLTTSTYLVPPGSAIRKIEEIDRAGVRVVGIDGSTTIAGAKRSLKAATVTPAANADEAMTMLRAGKADALAMGQTSLVGIAARIPGARVLDGHFFATSTAIAVPKGRAAALAYVSAFIEEAKAAGIVRRALDKAGFKDVAVAPAGAR